VLEVASSHRSKFGRPTSGSGHFLPKLDVRIRSDLKGTAEVADDRSNCRFVPTADI